MVVRKRVVLILGLLLCMPSITSAAIFSIRLTTDDLGLGAVAINHAGNGSPVEDDRPGKLVTSSTANVGSILRVQTDNLAGMGTLTAPLLATITVHNYLDIQSNVPVGADIYAGVITLTNDSGNIADDGLGVRAFGIDTVALSPTFAMRYENPAYVSAGNPNGYQMEGSKEVSGGVGESDFDVWVGDQPGVPRNKPPHVDEEVIFDINDAQLNVPANSVRVLLTDIKAGDDDLFDLAINLTINLVGGGTIYNSYDFLSDAPDVFSQFGTDNVIEVDFSGASLGLTPSDLIDSFIIGARDDPADAPRGTDEHFRIHGFIVDVTTPEPTSLIVWSLLAAIGLVSVGRRRGTA